MIWAAVQMSVIGTTLTRKGGQSMSALPRYFRTHLFGYRERIVYLDAEIARCALDLGMAKEQLNGTQIARPAINEGRFGSAQ